jgi:hypothetical protein
LRAGAVDQNKHSPVLMHILKPVINIGVYQNTVDITSQKPRSLPHLTGGSLQKEVISDFIGENQFLSLEIWETPHDCFLEKSVNRF